MLIFPIMLKTFSMMVVTVGLVIVGIWAFFPPEKVDYFGFGCVTIAAMIIFFYLSNMRSQLQDETIAHARELDQHGRVTKGTIYNHWREDYKYEETYIDSTHTVERSGYFVAYHYTAPDPKGGSKLFTGSLQSSKAYNTLRDGDRITIRYLPKNPWVSRPEEWK
jgi:hypothetical protein